MKKISAGLLMFRKSDRGLEFFIVHPGGPFFKNKDAGVWSIPKGEVDGETDLLACASREFEEETGTRPPADPGSYVALGEIKMKSGKVVHAWGFEGQPSEFKSNMFEMEWPPKSGKIQQFPEVDRAEFLNAEQARQKLVPEQYLFIERLMEKLRVA